MAVKYTPLFEIHEQRGARMVEFAGFMMPVQYAGIIQEHNAVRRSVGMFDVSHMGEFFVEGENASRFLQRVATNDIDKLSPGRAQYTVMCKEDGGIIDDLIVYMRSPQQFMVIVNASNIEKDFDWLNQHLTDGVDLRDRSHEFSLIAVQGRNAQATLQKLTARPLAELKPFTFAEDTLDGSEAFIARTGYTGEDGFELVIPVNYAERVWTAIEKAGEEFDILPAGLGARDTLRVEMKYSLYGNDIDESTNPIEAGLGWITKLEKGDFIGRDRLQEVKTQGPARRLVGFKPLERAVPRHGYKLSSAGNEIGVVTSGTFSPTLQQSIGIGYVNSEFSEVGNRISIVIREKDVPAEVVPTPFYKRDY